MPGPARDYSSLFTQESDEETDEDKKKKKKYSKDMLKRRLSRGNGYA